MFFVFFSPSFLPYSPPHQALCVDFAAEADGREQNILLQFFVLATRVKCQMGNDKDRNSLPGAQEEQSSNSALSSQDQYNTFFWGLLVSLVGSLPRHRKSKQQLESGIQAIKVFCAMHQNTTRVGSFTSGAKKCTG